MADINYLRTILANSGADAPTLNAIRALLDSGQVSDQDLSKLQLSGSAGPSVAAPQNALVQALDAAKPDASAFGLRDQDRAVNRQVSTPDGPAFSPRLGDLDHELQRVDDQPLTPQELVYRDALASGAGDSGASNRLDAFLRSQVTGQPSTDDLRKQGANFVRNESTGQTIYLGPSGQASDRPTVAAAGGGQAQGQPARPAMMQVIGTSGGSRVTLSPEQAPDKVNLDYSQNPLQLFGGAKAIYSKDEPGVAYVMGDDGRPKTKVLLGYDLQGSMQLNKANTELAKDQQSIAQSQAATAHTLEETRASKVNNPDWLGVDGAEGATPGNVDLSKVPPGVLQQAQAMANGDMAVPSTRSGKLSPIAALAFQINPNLKQTDYIQKQATVRDFAPNGTDGQKVKQVNQALHHAGLLLDTIGDLNNFNVAPGIFNPVKNTLGPMLNGADVAPGVYKETADALSAEVRKVYAGSGGGTEGELRDWQASFNPNASQIQQRAYLQRGMDLLKGGIQALQSSYTRGMGPSAKFGDLLDGPARAGLAKIMQGGVDPGIGEIVGVSQSPATQPATKAQGQSFASLPNPAQFSGKRMQDDKGNVYRSNGTAWVRQ